MVREPSILPEPEDVPIRSVDDLVIENLTDQTIHFDESSTDVLEIFAVTGGDKKRVEDNERKMTDGDRKLFRRAKEAVLQSWLDQIFRHCEQEGCWRRSSDESSMGVDVEVLRQSVSRPRTDRSSSRQHHTFWTLNLTVRGVKQVEAGVTRHQDGILVRRRGPP